MQCNTRGRKIITMFCIGKLQIEAVVNRKKSSHWSGKRQLNTASLQCHLSFQITEFQSRKGIANSREHDGIEPAHGYEKGACKNQCHLPVTFVFHHKSIQFQLCHWGSLLLQYQPDIQLVISLPLVYKAMRSVHLDFHHFRGQIAS